jgi:hypothetical protein
MRHSFYATEDTNTVADSMEAAKSSFTTENRIFFDD